MTEIAVIVGVSATDGLGAAIARRFAREGLTVVVAGRTRDRLQEVESQIVEAGGQAVAHVCDATVESDVQQLMESAKAKGRVESVIFNVGNNMPIEFEQLEADTFEQFWRVCTFAGFLVAKAALPLLKPEGGSLLFTGASASLRGRPYFAHFCAAKAALRALAQSLAKDYGPQGVHVGHVVVDGGINGQRLKDLAPQWLEELGEDGSLSPDAIADIYWFLHAQPRNTWSFEVDARPFKEKW